MVFKDLDGGDKRDRTADLLNAIQALSQLSYTPIFCCAVQTARDMITAHTPFVNTKFDKILKIFIHAGKKCRAKPTGIYFLRAPAQRSP